MQGHTMKGPKRLLSVLLAASLSVWCVPAGALAEEAWTAQAEGQARNREYRLSE